VEGLCPQGAAKFLGVSLRALHDLNNRGWLPEPVRLGGSDRLPRWSKGELRLWLQYGAPHRRRWATMRPTLLRRVG